MADATEQDEAAYQFFRRHQRRHGGPPSVRQVGRHLGLSQPNNAARNLDRLVAAGRLEKDEHGGYRLPAAALRYSLAIAGPVAAGDPLAVGEAGDERFDFEAEFDPEECCMYRVRGESMIDAHIAPGDLVVVRRVPEAEDGDTVVAEIDGDLTLKVLHLARGEGHRWLHPRNRGMKPIRLDPARGDCVKGVLVGVVRRTGR